MIMICCYILYYPCYGRRCCPCHPALQVPPYLMWCHNSTFGFKLKILVTKTNMTSEKKNFYHISPGCCTVLHSLKSIDYLELPGFIILKIWEGLCSDHFGLIVGVYKWDMRHAHVQVDCSIYKENNTAVLWIKFWALVNMFTFNMDPWHYLLRIKIWAVLADLD